MHKKLGPLEAWQWAAILAGLLLVYYEYEKSKAASTTSTTPAGTTADTSGAIDPTTGLPYASEGGVSGGGGGVGDTTGTGGGLQQELSDLGAIEGLMSGLGLGTGGSTTNVSGLSSSQTRTLNTDLRKLNKTIGKDQTTIAKLQKQVTKLTKTEKRTRPGDHKNPGHAVTTHGTGKKTAASSAPHNAQQHKNIAPPAHQRAHRTVKT